ncbi:MAG: redoxin domain-containing protein [Nitrospira sp.]|nr:redoxin domain-containing protein [bacterium]MBL7049870.1 redoxin domain-containing protein [Nitrospira sp.]
MKKLLMFIVMAIFLLVSSASYALKVGDKAPGFEVPSTHGNIILSEFEGKKNIVLAIYYADFTPV